MEEFSDQMTAEYRKIFFKNPGLTGKTTLLAEGQNIRLFDNLYQCGTDTALCDPDIARLAGRRKVMEQC